MTVLSNLALTGPEVAPGDPTMPLDLVCSRLAEKKIGALVMVDESRRVIGIVSERDIVRVIASNGAAALQSPASAHMTRSVVTCSRRETVDEVMETMTRGRFRHVPVVEDGELVGIISIGDVVKHRMAEIEREAQEIRNYIATA